MPAAVFSRRGEEEEGGSKSRRIHHTHTQLGLLIWKQEQLRLLQVPLRPIKGAI